jgi:Tol biopolymer transport system component
MDPGSDVGRRLPDGSRKIQPFTDSKGTTPAANISSTVEDLAKFILLQFDRRKLYLSEERDLETNGGNMRTRASKFLILAGVVCAIFLSAFVAAGNARNEDPNPPAAAKFEMVYSESPAAWFEAMNIAARVSSDGRWCLFRSFGKGLKLIDLETRRENAQKLASGMDRVFNAAFFIGDQLARLGRRGSQQGWFLPSPEGLRFTSLPPDASPQWTPDGTAVAYYRLGQPEKGFFVGDAERQRQYPIEGSLSGFIWSPDGAAIYAAVWHEDGLTSLVRIDRASGRTETMVKDLDAPPRLSPISISADGQRLYLALASAAAPIAKARHDPNADRDLDIYELELSTGIRRVVIGEPGDDFAPGVADGFLYWTHNDIRDAVVVLPSSGGEARVVEDAAEIPYWSPDGKKIAFMYGAWRLADWALNLDAGVIAVDSQAHPVPPMKPLITGYHEDFTPAWSPDGKWLAFHSHRSPSPVSSYEGAGSTDDIYLRPASGGPGDEIRLTDFAWEDGVADWSPDGRSLVFDSWERSGIMGISKPWIITIDPATGKPLKVERLPLPDPMRNARWGSWSPKGDEIAFEESGQGNARNLWAVSRDGKSAQKIASYTSSTYGGLDWMPDGKTIVFCGLAGERMQLFAVPRTGGSPRQLTKDAANLMHPQVSPDGRWIACTRMAITKGVRRLKF